MLVSRQLLAGPSCRTCAQLSCRSLHSAQVVKAPFGVKESNRPHTLHLSARKQQLREAVQTGKGAAVENFNDFEKLLDGNDRQSRRPQRHAVDDKRRQIESLGRKPSMKRLQAVFGDELPRRPTRALKYPSQIKKFVASKLETLPDRSAPPRLLPRDVSDPFLIADKLKKFVQVNRVNGVLGNDQMGQAVSIVRNAPRQAQNAVVWNQLLALVGAEGMLDRQFKLFNDMKKRGIKPTTRTFSTLLAAYVPSQAKATRMLDQGQQEAVEPRKLSRATLIFDMAMTHLRNLVQRPVESSVDNGLGLPTLQEDDSNDVPGRHRRFEPLDEASVAPVNAYLSFCAHYGRWSEMQRVFLALDRSGPLSPDRVTYTIMFKALALAQRPEAGAQNESSAGITPRALWDQAVRQFRTPDETLSVREQSQRQIDSILVNQAITCMVNGRWEDQKFAIDLIPRLYNLSLPGESASAPNIPTSAALASLPTISLDVKSATSILNLVVKARKHDIASHFAHLFLANPAIIKEADLSFFCICITAFCENRDIEAALDIIESYQPPSVGPVGWPKTVWHSILNAARWAKDWRSALIVFRKMTHLPEGIEHSRESSGQRRNAARLTGNDARGVRWITPDPRRADAQAMSLLLKTSLNSRPETTLQALRVFAYYPASQWTNVAMPSLEERKALVRRREYLQDQASTAGRTLTEKNLPQVTKLSLVTGSPDDVQLLTVSQRKDLQWILTMLLDVERAIKRVLESLKIVEGERKALVGLQADVASMLRKWERVNKSDGIRHDWHEKSEQ